MVRRSVTRWALAIVAVTITTSVYAQFPFDPDSGDEPTLAPLLREVTPAVVNIAVESQRTVAANPLLSDPFFNRFFNFEMPDAPQMVPQRSAGSGVIIDAEAGYVLTNHHVVGEADSVVVTLSDKRQFDAELVGTDEATDIALLKIDADNLTAISIGDSEELEVGDFVVAIGNPFGLGQTVTSGIVSALGRNGLNVEGYEDFIQTDASINPGNSGGALINLSGELVGINTAIIAPAGGNVGIGFAVPTNMATEVKEQLLEYGEVRRGRLGILIQDMTPAIADALDIDVGAGAVISQVEPDSPAEEAGLRPGDVIVEFDGRQVDSSSDLRNMVGLMRLGSTAEIRLLRDGESRTVEATIGRAVDGGGLSANREDARTLEKLQGAEFRELGPEHPQFGEIEGVVVGRVDQGSPAARNGLRAGDVITAVNRQRVSSVNELSSIVQETTGALALNVVRDNTPIFIIVQ